MNMKQIITIFSLVVVIGLFAGCASTRIKHLPPDRFVEQAKQMEIMASACWTDFIGCSHNRAYLEYGDVLWFGPKPRTIVYWTELNGLPKDIADKLMSGNPPWRSWQETIKTEDNKEMHPTN